MLQTIEQIAARKQESASLGLAANLHHFRAAKNELPSHRITPATAKLIVQPSISINSGLFEDPGQQGDADFMAVGVQYREASPTLDHIKMLAVPKGPANPNFAEASRVLGAKYGATSPLSRPCVGLPDLGAAEPWNAE